MRKIEVPTDSVPEFELGHTMTDIHQRRQDREAREREDAQQQREEEAKREEARVEETHSQDLGVAEKRSRTKKSGTETEAIRGEVGPSVTIEEGPYDHH